jgi:hypothetical protein
MKSANNERGSVLVFVTLMIVLLLIMVGMGLDTGHLAFIRAQGQPAVDAAAMAAASAIPTGDLAQVTGRAAAFNYTGSNTAGNNYMDSNNNKIGAGNVTLINYNPNTGAITAAAIGTANGARVALESSNPYDAATTATPMKSPLFLTPLFNLFGQSVKTTADVSVSAVAVLRGVPDLPIAAELNICGSTTPPWTTNTKQKLLQSDKNNDTSGYTTYWIQNASKTEVNNLLKAGNTCDMVPPIGIGYCTELQNGQTASLYNEFQALFNVNQSRCYFIPVVKNGASWNQCSPIVTFAKFCPIQGDDGFGLGKTKANNGWDRYIYGNVTCGEDPYSTSATKCYVPTLVRDVKSGM